MKTVHILLLSCILLFSSYGCGTHIENPYRNEEIYTRLNMRYHAGKRRGSYIAYKSWNLLPVNSKVRISGIRSNGFMMKLPSGEIVSYIYNQKWGRKPIIEILPLLFADTDVSARISKFNEIEQEGIKNGEAEVGMSKEAVLVALGYPATHRTPSIEENIWEYWQTGRKVYSVEFESNRVSQVVGDGSRHKTAPKPKNTTQQK